MALVSEIDYGTPAAKTESQVTLTIDGIAVTVPEGTSIMRAAMEAGIKVPKLCATDMLDAFGSCRLCLVEIEGRPGTPGGPGAVPPTARPIGAAGPTQRGAVVRSVRPGLSWAKQEIREYSAARAPMIVGSEAMGATCGSG